MSKRQPRYIDQRLLAPEIQEQIQSVRRAIYHLYEGHKLRLGNLNILDHQRDANDVRLTIESVADPEDLQLVPITNE